MQNTQSKIYMSTSSSIQRKTGDVDYVVNLIQELKHQGINAELHNSDIETGREQIDYILRDSKKNNVVPIFHLFINADYNDLFTGKSFSLEDLEYFKKNGGKLVVTAVEFKKYPILGREHNKIAFKERFKLADEIIFLDKIDKNACLNEPIFQESDVREKVERAHISFSPSTVQISNKNKSIEQRGRNLLMFGIIRDYRGIGDTLNVAQILREKGTDKKIMLTGSILKGITKPKLLKDILIRVYGEQIKDDIINAGDDLNALKSIAIKYQGRETINVELHFDIEERDLHKIFNQCTYSINLYPQKGITPHFSNVSNPLCLPGGSIFYGISGDLTPEPEDFEGRYPNLFRVNRKIEADMATKKQSINNWSGDDIFAPPTDLQYWIVDDLLSREPNFDFEAFKMEHSKFMKEHPMTIETIAKQHANQIYGNFKLDTSIPHLNSSYTHDNNQSTILHSSIFDNIKPELRSSSLIMHENSNFYGNQSKIQVISGTKSSSSMEMGT